MLSSSAGETLIAHDWAQEVKKYVAAPDDAAIKGIIRHCGITLQNRDAQFVACTDKKERADEVIE
jgi:hypothetical protein